MATTPDIPHLAGRFWQIVRTSWPQEEIVVLRKELRDNMQNLDEWNPFR